MYIFIVNNEAGKGAKIWKKTLSLVKKMQLEYKTYFVTSTKELMQLKNELTPLTVKAVVIVGGDGTIHHILPYILGTEIPIGVIPAGSGNDFARALHIPKNYRKALQKIVHGECRKIDIMKVNDRPCTTIVGVGFDAKVAELTNHSKMKRWLNFFKLGGLAYVVNVLRTLMFYKPTTLKLTIDDKTTEVANTWFVAVANTPFYGGGLKIVPDAVETDGILNLCIPHSLSRLEILLFFPLVYLGRHTFHRSVIVATGQRITITTSDTVLIQADGEMIDTTPAEITIERSALTVII